MKNTDSILTETDQFDRIRHPDAFNEIRVMARHVAQVNGTFKREILVSFLRDHSINVDWLAGNEMLVEMITSGSLKIHYTERLFEAERSNKAFLADLEGYIETELTNSVSDCFHRNVLTTSAPVGAVEGQRYYGCSASGG